MLTKEDVAQFHCTETSEWGEAKTNLIDLFTVLVRTGKVSPSWHPRLTRHCLFSFARMYAWELRDILPSLKTRIYPFLDNTGVEAHEIVQLLILYNRATLDNRHANKPGREEIPELMNRRLARECLRHPSVLLSSLLSDEQWSLVFHKRIPKNGFLAAHASPVKNCLLPLLPPCREEAKQILRERMDKLKENLMEVAWHPDRVSAWLKVGGFELLENLM